MIAFYLLIALLAGFYARTMYDWLKKVKDYLQDRLESPPGVVKPEGRKITRSVVNDNETGGILRKSPNQIALENMQERDQRIKDLSL